MENPFRVEVYDKDFHFKGFVGNPVTLVVTPRYNQTGTGALTVETDHARIGDLLADGARLVIYYHGNFLMSGKIDLRKAQGPMAKGQIDLYFKDDFRLMHQTLGWPVPGSAITDQSASEFATYTGNAETILKNVVTANMITRLGLPVSCAANLNRGATVPDGVTFRFHPLVERLYPALETAGIGVTFRQTGAGIVCDAFVPPVFARTLTEASGVITDWNWSSEDAAATRVVGGGNGNATARMFRLVVDTALEAAQNDKFEIFRDASDGDTAEKLISRAQESLDENAPKSGFSLALSETEHFQYGKDGLVVGAKVTVDLGFASRTDILRECTLSYTRNEGLRTTPVIGDISNSPDKTIAQFLARLKKGIADLKVSK